MSIFLEFGYKLVKDEARGFNLAMTVEEISLLKEQWMKISHFSYSDKNYKALKYLFLLKLDCQLFWEHEYY